MVDKWQLQIIEIGSELLYINDKSRIFLNLEQFMNKKR